MEWIDLVVTSHDYTSAVLVDTPSTDASMPAHEAELNAKWDVFISHASEDKLSVAAPLAYELRKRDLGVWYDDFALELGDSLRRSIDTGLSRCRFGIVVLSRNFFAKEWPQRELDGLLTREFAGSKVVLPIWHGISQEEVVRFSPTMADRVAISTERGLPVLVDAIINVVNGQAMREAVVAPTDVEADRLEERGRVEEQTGNFSMAAEWYAEAAELGSLSAQHKLGLMFRDGRGVPQDNFIATVWLRKAAAQNSSNAMYHLAELYRGINEEFEAAVWHRKAASLGLTESMFRLAQLYEEGKGVSRDYQEAIQWYQAFADSGRDTGGTAERAVVRLKTSPLDRFLRHLKNPRADI